VCDPAAATQCDVFDLGGLLSGFVLMISFEAVTVMNWEPFFSFDFGPLLVY
jgi:RsiW-degrading membrane proteinase PrsW (M82 family)